MPPKRPQNLSNLPAIHEHSYIKRILTTFIMLSAFMGLLVLGWFAYEENVNPPDLSQIPLIKANPNPFKLKPANPGGMQVANTDKIVFNIIDNNTKKELDSAVEKLLPEPEEPINKQKLAQKIKVKKKEEQSEKEFFLEVVDISAKKSASSGAKKTFNLDAVIEKKNGRKLVKLARIPMKPFISENSNIVIKGAAIKQAIKNPALKASPIKTTKKQPLKGYKIQLGSYKIRDNLEKGWKSLRRKFPKYLSGLTHESVHVELGSKGVFYRLHAGSFNSRDAASKLCKKLLAKKQGCLVVK